MKFTSNILKGLGVRIKNILWSFGLHAFLLIIFFIFIDFILGGFVFYKYVFLAEQEEPQITGSILKFNNNAYQSVMAELQTKEQSTQEPIVNKQPDDTEQLQGDTTQ